MYEFIEFVLGELKNSFALVLIVVLAVAAVLAGAYTIHRKKYAGMRKFPWGRALLWLMLVGYLAVVLYATLLRWYGGYRQVNLHLFRAWREAWNNFSTKNWANVLLNVAMFIPLGILLPAMWKKLRKWYIMVPAGFAVSLAIELTQLVICRGICDVDDLFANTLGAVMGYFMVMTVLSVPEERGKRFKPSGVYGALSVLSVMAICSIFVVYEYQEFGNLPNAAAYTNNTRGVQWHLDCEMPDAQEQTAVYRTVTRPIGACDVFAEEFRQIIDTEYTMVTYYQEAAYYMDQAGDENGHHFLFLDYLDQSYEYSCGYGDEPVWADADRETMEAALEKYPLLIPEYAEFTVEGDGWHSFSVAQHIEGEEMVDGTLRCRYAEDGTIREIQNELLSYTYYDDVEIISPEEAYELLITGKFYDGCYFENRSPAVVTVLSCTQGHEVDTKGFYQPVYYFDVVSADGSYQDRIMIPAMQ